MRAKPIPTFFYFDRYYYFWSIKVKPHERTNRPNFINRSQGSDKSQEDRSGS
jgi:hypothetical protein